MDSTMTRKGKKKISTKTKLNADKSALDKLKNFWKNVTYLVRKKTKTILGVWVSVARTVSLSL